MYNVVFQDGRLKSGFGIIVYGNEYYEGNTANSMEFGKGVYHTFDAKTFKGEYEHGRIYNGEGVNYLDASLRFRYEGKFKNGKRSSKGSTIDLLDPARSFDAEWKDDVPLNGQAIFVYPNGDFYAGNWRDGEKEGEGVYFTRLGFRYEGVWEKGFMKISM